MAGQPGARGERDFPHALDSVRAARHFAVGIVEPRYGRRVADDAAIVVTELAANAFQHAGTGFRVTVHCAPDGIRVSVRDHGSLRDGMVRPPVQGHGLHLVDQLSGTWGTTPLPGGKTVWARLPVY